MHSARPGGGAATKKKLREMAERHMRAYGAERAVGGTESKPDEREFKRVSMRFGGGRSARV